MTSGTRQRVGHRGPPQRRRRLSRRRTRLLTRTAPLLVVLGLLGGGAFALGAYIAGSGARSERALVRRYLGAWSRGDWPAMYRLLSPASRRHLSLAGFSARLRDAEATATTTRLHFDSPIHLTRGAALTEATVSTSSFGTFRAPVRIALAPRAGAGLDFSGAMVFPGLHPGERLVRRALLGPRGTLEAADGTVLASGPQRSSADPLVSAAIVGSLGPIPSDERAAYLAAGYPPDAQVGQDGLELIFEHQLAGRPGGRLLAGGRVLAQRTPTPGATVRTTIDPRLEAAALNALGGAYAGMTVLNLHTGAIEAAAGLAFTDLQPPGSTFKIITSAAALQAGIATPQTVFPEQSQASVGGYVMQNAGGEVCGGALITAFAVSCDTTFAPLGIELGARRLVAAAERFGFDQPTDIPTALESTIPSASAIGDATAVGSTAIGQGRLLASTLEMADVAAAIANGGRRPIPSFAVETHPRTVAATTARVASQVQTMMEAVVASGTGQSAAIPGYHVAGKTGTAELASTANQQNNVKETDAWFVGYVPDSRAGVVACALFPANGYGATSAAPAVRAVLEAALQR